MVVMVVSMTVVVTVAGAARVSGDVSEGVIGEVGRTVLVTVTSAASPQPP